MSNTHVQMTKHRERIARIECNIGQRAATQPDLQLVLSACEAAASDTNARAVLMHFVCPSAHVEQQPWDERLDGLLKSGLTAIIECDLPIVAAVEGCAAHWIVELVRASECAIAASSARFEVIRPSLLSEEAIDLVAEYSSLSSWAALERGIVKCVASQEFVGALAWSLVLGMSRGAD